MLKTIERILHPTDFSAASEIALAHALKLGIKLGATIDLLHVNNHKKEQNASHFPKIHAVLNRWNNEKSSRSNGRPPSHGVHVNKIIASQKDPLKATLRYLDKHPADLIVLATHSRKNYLQWLCNSIAEPLARHSRIMTLFVPNDVKGFVSIEDGDASLKKMIIPIDHDPDPQLAVDASFFFTKTLGIDSGTISLVHVGQEEDMPTTNLSEKNSCDVKKIVRSGNVVEQIIRVCETMEPDLVIMTTRGHHGFLDAFRGSITERVLHGVRCSVLAVPAI